MSLKVVSQVSKDTQVPGEDWDCLMWHNGKLFSAGYSNGNIKVWTPELTLIKEFTAHDYPIYHLCPGKGSTFFSSSSDCTIKLWEEKQGDFVLLESLQGHQEPPRKLRFDGKSNRLYSGDETGKVLIWQEGKLLAILETMEEIWDMIVYNELLITSRLFDVIINTVYERDERIRHSIKNTIPGKGPLLITGDDKLCFLDRTGFQVHVNEITTGNPNVAKLEGHTAIINGMTVHNNVLYTGGGDNKIIAWDLKTYKKIGEVELEGCVNDMTVNCESGVVYAAGHDKAIVGVKMS